MENDLSGKNLKFIKKKEIFDNLYSYLIEELLIKNIFELRNIFQEKLDENNFKVFDNLDNYALHFKEIYGIYNTFNINKYLNNETINSDNETIVDNNVFSPLFNEQEKNEEKPIELEDECVNDYENLEREIVINIDLLNKKYKLFLESFDIINMIIDGSIDRIYYLYKSFGIDNFKDYRGNFEDIFRENLNVSDDLLEKFKKYRYLIRKIYGDDPFNYGLDTLQKFRELDEKIIVNREKLITFCNKLIYYYDDKIIDDLKEKINNNEDFLRLDPNISESDIESLNLKKLFVIKKLILFKKKQIPEFLVYNIDRRLDLTNNFCFFYFYNELPNRFDDFQFRYNYLQYYIKHLKIFRNTKLSAEKNINMVVKDVKKIISDKDNKETISLKKTLTEKIKEEIENKKISEVNQDSEMVKLLAIKNMLFKLDYFNFDGSSIKLTENEMKQLSNRLGIKIPMINDIKLLNDIVKFPSEFKIDENTINLQKQQFYNTLKIYVQILYDQLIFYYIYLNKEHKIIGKKVNTIIDYRDYDDLKYLLGQIELDNKLISSLDYEAQNNLVIYYEKNKTLDDYLLHDQDEDLKNNILYILDYPSEIKFVNDVIYYFEKISENLFPNIEFEKALILLGKYINNVDNLRSDRTINKIYQNLFNFKDSSSYFIHDELKNIEFDKLFLYAFSNPEINNNFNIQGLLDKFYENNDNKLIPSKDSFSILNKLFRDLFSIQDKIDKESFGITLDEIKTSVDYDDIPDNFINGDIGCNYFLSKDRNTIIRENNNQNLSILGEINIKNNLYKENSFLEKILVLKGDRLVPIKDIYIEGNSIDNNLEIINKQQEEKNLDLFLGVKENFYKTTTGKFSKIYQIINEWQKQNLNDKKCKFKYKIRILNVDKLNNYEYFFYSIFKSLIKNEVTITESDYEKQIENNINIFKRNVNLKYYEYYKILIDCYIKLANQSNPLKDKTDLTNKIIELLKYIINTCRLNIQELNSLTQTDIFRIIFKNYLISNKQIQILKKNYKLKRLDIDILNENDNDSNLLEIIKNNPIVNPMLTELSDSFLEYRNLNICEKFLFSKKYYGYYENEPNNYIEFYIDPLFRINFDKYKNKELIVKNEFYPVIVFDKNCKNIGYHYGRFKGGNWNFDFKDLKTDFLIKNDGSSVLIYKYKLIALQSNYNNIFNFYNVNYSKNIQEIYDYLKTDNAEIGIPFDEILNKINFFDKNQGINQYMYNIEKSKSFEDINLQSKYDNVNFKIPSNYDYYYNYKNFLRTDDSIKIVFIILREKFKEIYKKFKKIEILINRVNQDNPRELENIKLSTLFGNSDTYLYDIFTKNRYNKFESDKFFSKPFPYSKLSKIIKNLEQILDLYFLHYNEDNDYNDIVKALISDEYLHSLFVEINPYFEIKYGFNISDFIIFRDILIPSNMENYNLFKNLISLYPDRYIFNLYDSKDMMFLKDIFEYKVDNNQQFLDEGDFKKLYPENNDQIIVDNISPVRLRYVGIDISQINIKQDSYFENNEMPIDFDSVNNIILDFILKNIVEESRVNKKNVIFKIPKSNPVSLLNVITLSIFCFPNGYLIDNELGKKLKSEWNWRESFLNFNSNISGNLMRIIKEFNFLFIYGTTAEFTDCYKLIFYIIYQIFGLKLKLIDDISKFDDNFVNILKNDDNKYQLILKLENREINNDAKLKVNVKTPEMTHNVNIPIKSLFFRNFIYDLPDKYTKGFKDRFNKMFRNEKIIRTDNNIFEKEFILSIPNFIIIFVVNLKIEVNRKTNYLRISAYKNVEDFKYDKLKNDPTYKENYKNKFLNNPLFTLPPSTSTSNYVKRNNALANSYKIKNNTIVIDNDKFEYIPFTTYEKTNIQEEINRIKENLNVCDNILN